MTRAKHGEKLTPSPKVLLLVGVTLLLSFCSVHRQASDTIEGWVVDAETSMPIKGAVVVAEWRGLPTGFFYSETGGGVSFKVQEALTDENGRFVLPAWSRVVFSIWGVDMLEDQPWLYTFNEGYQSQRIPSFIKPKYGNKHGYPRKASSRATFNFSESDNILKLRKIRELTLSDPNGSTVYGASERLMSTKGRSKKICLITDAPEFFSRFSTLLGVEKSHFEARINKYIGSWYGEYLIEPKRAYCTIENACKNRRIGGVDICLLEQ